MKQCGYMVVCFVVLVALTSGKPPVIGPEGLPRIPAVLSQLGLSTLLQLEVEGNLGKTIHGPGEFTVFGPTNEAFDNLPPAIQAYIQDPANLAKVLRYHVIPAKALSTDLVNELVLPTFNGKSLRINVYTQNEITVATAQCAPIDLSRADQLASNGVVHVLDQVMIPPTGPMADYLGSSDQFQTLATALKAAGLFDTLNGDGPFTLFAPTDAAFNALPEGTVAGLLANITMLQDVLLYHVVSGTFCKAGLTTGPVSTLQMGDVEIEVSDAGEVTANGLNVLSYGNVISVTNGVVHPIDGVLLPPKV